jgi:glutamate synthase domain-containing protein 3
MSGGIAFVYDEDGTFSQRCNTAMVTLEKVQDEAEQARTEAQLVADGNGRLRHAEMSDEALLRGLVERHLRFTASTRALAMLDNWDATRAKFVRVFPNEYKRALGELFERRTVKPALNRQREAV